MSGIISCVNFVTVFFRTGLNRIFGTVSGSKLPRKYRKEGNQIKLEQKHTKVHDVNQIYMTG